MTKSQPQISEKKVTLENIYEQPLSRQMLLRSHTATEKILDEAKKINDESGSEIEVADRWSKSTPTGYSTKKLKASEMFIQYESEDKDRKN